MKKFRMKWVTLPSCLVVGFLVGQMMGGNTATAEAPCEGYVALTYDDGPTEHTAELSEALREHGLRATFFVRGDAAVANPEVIRQLVEDGHAVENHTYDHYRVTDLTEEAAERQVLGTNQVLLEITGSAPRLFRPPFGATNGETFELARKYGLTEVLWTLDTHDYVGGSAAELVASLEDVAPGDVVLMHDDSESDVAAVPMLSEVLSSRNLCAGRLVPSLEPVTAWEETSYFARVVR